MSTHQPHPTPRTLPGLLCLVMLALVWTGVGVVAQSRRDISVSARRYAFTVSDSADAVIRVRQGDLVRITFTAEDIPHSFTVDDDPYRISKRAEPGKAVTIEFHADRTGRFPIYCNLTIDDRCREELRGVLLVSSR